MSSYKFCTQTRPLGAGAKLPYSEAWYVQFRWEGLRLDSMSEDAEFADDPAWLMLPLSRREIALHRRAIMLDYERHAAPGDAEADAAADRMGITSGQFYRIRRRWLADRSIFSLLPFGMPGATRKPKLDKEVSEAVRKLVRKAIERDGLRTPAGILKEVQRNWALDKPIPSHMTLRKSIAVELGEVRDVSGGIFLTHSSIPQSWVADATGYGDLVAIDYGILQVFVATEGGPVAPLVTLVIDVFTSSICGFHVSFGAPGALQFEAALKDAEKRTKSAAETGTKASRPRLVFEAATGSGWSQLIARMEKHEVKAKIRRTQRLHFGETVGSLIGNEIGVVKFAKRRLINDIVFNPGQDPLVSLKELQKLLDDGVQALNERRIPADIVVRPLKFDF